MPVTNTRTWMLPFAAALLASCATGHDGDVNIGSGQSPDPVTLDIPVAYVRGPLPEDLEDLDDLDVRELETFEQARTCGFATAPRPTCRRST